ncbi:CatB-related O-acetyltransferase [Paeniglutamicibacter sp. ABSL32-1]|uniref:CatB-related O-acetyltransferase n=1 Tax=Paeniglutamicibacter quisquiliarum TaxID=2849498 RepID=UPI001C2DE8D6|nr:CatB-related O-acetyltransferase [Paeniglutamicibacter quisquiliarum]MBV1780715.1 CatB-related O-acetyltransferase [Paeniglutamicibacter quisquiliarum]
MDITAGRYTYGQEKIRLHATWPNSKGVKIGSFCSIAGGVQIIAGGNHRTDWVTTWPFGKLSTDKFPFDDKGQQPTSKGDVIIQNDVWLGQSCTILSGVTIGHGAVVATQAVVTKDVPPYAIVGGNPAKVLKYRFDGEAIAKLLELKWWDLTDEQISPLVPFLCQPDVNLLIEKLQATRSDEVITATK